jgi:RimJ/RimL family protein N-acetyltransferase
MPWPLTVTLTGNVVRLEPLGQRHATDLREAAAEGDLWNLWYTRVPKPDEVEAEIERRLSLREKGSMLPFAVVEVATGEAVGMTTYMNIDAETKRVEIGSTWYRKRVQRTALNTECKLLLLAHAFETLNCVAVELRTSTFNLASRRAIERLGAKLDGILRSHIYHPDGTLRDSCCYSIIASEWPAVRANLLARLSKPYLQE